VDNTTISSSITLSKKRFVVVFGKTGKKDQKTTITLLA
jgi:hypothetical protein